MRIVLSICVYYYALNSFTFTDVNCDMKKSNKNHYSDETNQ